MKRVSRSAPTARRLTAEQSPENWAFSPNGFAGRAADARPVCVAHAVRASALRLSRVIGCEDSDDGAAGQRLSLRRSQFHGGLHEALEWLDHAMKDRRWPSGDRAEPAIEVGRRRFSEQASSGLCFRRGSDGGSEIGAGRRARSTIDGLAPLCSSGREVPHLALSQVFAVAAFLHRRLRSSVKAGVRCAATHGEAIASTGADVRRPKSELGAHTVHAYLSDPGEARSVRLSRQCVRVPSQMWSAIGPAVGQQEGMDRRPAELSVPGSSPSPVSTIRGCVARSGRSSVDVGSPGKLPIP